jgi:hypothetical protein
MGCNVAIDRAREASPQVTEEGPLTRAVAVCKTASCDWRMPKIRKQQASVRVG